jgi:threonine aldolase
MALSTRERIASARIWRKRYGAGMRQVGLLAAAADYAITHHIADLKEDHRRAQELATAIAQIDSSLIDPSSVSTNIVGLDLKAVGVTAAELARRTKESGLLIGALGPYFARLVTHRDFDDTECAQAIEILRKTLVSQ